MPNKSTHGVAPSAAAICDAFKLGIAVPELEPIKGGLLHTSDNVAEIPEAALAGLLVKHLSWLGAHVRRSLDDAVESRVEQQIAVDRVPHLVATMRHLHSGIDRWISWLN